MNDKDQMQEKLLKKVEDKITFLLNSELRQDNIDYLYKLVDIHKDLKNEEYWKQKEENMIYRTSGYGNYGEEYGRGRARDSRGRFMGEENYGAYNRHYRGHDMIDEMAEHYGNYMDNKENGRYGGEMTKALDYMLQSVEAFMKMLKDDASSKEEVEMIRRTAKRISEM